MFKETEKGRSLASTEITKMIPGKSSVNKGEQMRLDNVHIMPALQATLQMLSSNLRAVVNL